MRKIMVLLYFIAMGVVGFGVFPSIAAWALSPQPFQSITSQTTPNSSITRGTGEETSLGLQPYVVRRESSGPPGESHSGRASSSPISGIAESSRQSSSPLDLSTDEIEKQIQGEKTESQKEFGTTPKQRRDPTEGGGQSHPVIKKRRGVLD